MKSSDGSQVDLLWKNFRFLLGQQPLILHHHQKPSSSAEKAANALDKQIVCVRITLGMRWRRLLQIAGARLMVHTDALWWCLLLVYLVFLRQSNLVLRRGLTALIEIWLRCVNFRLDLISCAMKEVRDLMTHHYGQGLGKVALDTFRRWRRFVCFRLGGVWRRNGSPGRGE